MAGRRAATPAAADAEIRRGREVGRQTGSPRSQERTAGIRQPDAIQVFDCGKSVFLVHESDNREKDHTSQGQAHRNIGQHPLPLLGNPSNARLTQRYRDPVLVEEAKKIMKCALESQDNENWHLLVVNEKMKEAGINGPWYLFPPIPLLMVGFYAAVMHVMAFDQHSQGVSV